MRRSIVRLYLLDLCRRNNYSILEAFEIAFFAKFQKEPVVHNDYASFVQHGVIPRYVVEWLEEVKKTDNGRSVP